MPPFRFNIPFFSYGSTSRLSSGNSSSSPPPKPPPSRPPFRPAGIAQSSKPATSSETKSKGPPLLPRVKSNVAAISASSSASQSPSRGAVTPTRLAKESNQSGSPLKIPDSLRAGEQKVAMKDKTSREIEKEAEVEKLAVVERNAKTAQEQKRKETDKLSVEEKKKVLRKDMEENSKTAKEQHKRKDTEKLAVEAKNKVLRKDVEGNSKTAQEQQKRKETEKLAREETNRALQTVGQEDATRSKTTRHIAAASESSRGPRDQPERKTQNRTEIHTDDNRQRTKGISTGNYGNPRDVSSSMSRKIKEDIRDGISKLTWGKSNGDEKSVSVFTLTGENRGATMAINSEKDKKDGEVHIHRGYRSNPDESPNTTSTETEGGRRPFDGKNEAEEARVRAYVNGNTQGINNSIVCDSSVQENDPGIHMSLKFEESKKKDETISPPENVPEKKSETVSVTGKATEKLKYEPRVRRRCLRGLLAESSESEPENPLKPRRHGCRFTCKDKDIENT